MKWLFVALFLRGNLHGALALTACKNHLAYKKTSVELLVSTTRLSARRFRDDDLEHDELARRRSTDRPTLKQTQLIGPPIMPSKPKIVVLGASGRIGRLVVRQLLDMKHLDATIIACCRKYDKTIKVLYDDLSLAQTSTNQNGPRLRIVEADLVPPEELPGYEEDGEEESEWFERASSAAKFFNKSISEYDNRDEVSIVDANEALEGAIQDCTTVITCVGAVRPTNLWTDLLVVPLWRWLRADVSRWCRDPRHPYYVLYTSTRKILGIAEREQLRREAAVEMALEQEDEERDHAVVVPKIRLIRVSDNVVGSQRAWEMVPLVTNIFRSMVFRYHDMADRLLESSSLIDTVILRPGDLVDDERDSTTTHLQVDPSGQVSIPSIVGREDVAALAVASAMFQSPREKEARMESSALENEDAEATQQRQFAPFHCTLALRWVGREMRPYPGQGRKQDGYPTAQISLQKALKAIKRKEKQERREQLRQKRTQISPISDSMSYPSRMTKSLKARLRHRRQVKPYALVSAIPIYLILGLLARSLGRVLWNILRSNARTQQLVEPVENIFAAVFAFWMTNLRVVERMLGKLAPRGLGSIFGVKKYISF